MWQGVTTVPNWIGLEAPLGGDKVIKGLKSLLNWWLKTLKHTVKESRPLTSDPGISTGVWFEEGEVRTLIVATFVIRRIR